MSEGRVLAAPPSSRTSELRALLVTGLVATVAAMAATTLAAALAGAAGVDFEVPEGGESIPLPGFATMTGLFSLVGVVIAAGLQRWSARPAVLFLRTTLSLTAISLVPPLVSGAGTATVAALVALHLVAAGIVVPALSGSLRAHDR